MGVPKFYRWLSERYPLINQMISNGTMLPEIDNFYLDMNGIIHACTHPNDESESSAKLTIRDMMLAIFRYIDRCVSLIVKPKKLLFLAVDGCAPRAKLNQQRSRRFRAGQERVENMQKARQRGEVVDESTLFDSNCITPGTDFMELVDKHLKYYIHKKIKEDPIWRDLEVIYSGHDVPGEGEHKIIEWIRNERAKPDYQPNLRHCLYGQDADLIMLALCTHEPHFTLLREVINFNSGRPGMGARATVMKQTQDSKFQLLHLSILREYIEVEFSHKHSGGALSLERLVDDFVFLTFLVGNDFLPHLPTLDIGENGFDVIFNVYKQLQQESVGYLVENGELCDLERLEKLFHGIGLQESSILETREIEEKEFTAKQRKRNRRGGTEIMSLEDEEAAEEELQRAMEEAIADARAGTNESKGDDSDQKEKDDVSGNNDLQWDEKKTRLTSGKNKMITKEKTEEVINKSGKDYRARYYFSKFRITHINEKEFLAGLTEEYLKGLMWCLAYYVKGCVSWTWYFPYYYGPMLADMKQLVEKKSRINFELGGPFLPFQQLLGCLPPASKSLIPLPYQWLMTSEASPLKDKYPLDFEIDMNGKRNPWEAVVLLPFIDSSLLFEAEKTHCLPGQLTPKERARNTFGAISHYRFDPANNKTIPSCNADIGLPDIINCQSTVTKNPFSLFPGTPFSSQLIPNTVRTCAGFPSLGVIPIKSVSFEPVKLNVFGSDSKYKSIIIHVLIRAFDEKTIDMRVLLHRSIFVNYPLLHEAKVIGVSIENKSYIVKKKKQGSEVVESIEEREHDHFAKMQWRKEAMEEQTKYLKGRGIPGTGGINVEEVKMRLQVVPLQGMKLDRLTGARKKVFGTVVTDIPIQMALWTSPVVDARFEEREEQSVESMFPINTEVVATSGPFLGKKGRVVGPHKERDAGSREALGKEPAVQAKPRTVDVEFIVNPPEPPFGYALNISISDEYLSSRDVCKLLGITPSILGTVAGGLFLEEPRGADIGLDLKKNNEYQLLGYTRQVQSNRPRDSKGPTKPVLSAWGTGDTVQIIGSAVETEESNVTSDEKQLGGAGGVQWEYSGKAVKLISDYMEAFPLLFRNLQRLTNQRRYSVADLFGTSGGSDEGYADGVAVLDRVLLWLKQQPYYFQPRSPLTTLCMSKDAIRAVERAADVLVSNLQQPENVVKIVRKGVPVESIFRGHTHSPYDSPLVLEGQNTDVSSSSLACATQALPELGDRVINLVASGVPFGLRGTVIAIHSVSAFVEVLFDEEFGNGKSLQGLCSQFRGALVPWHSVLRVSTNSLTNTPVTSAPTSSSSSTSNQSSKSNSSKSVKGQLPPPVHKAGTPKPKPTIKDAVSSIDDKTESGNNSTDVKNAKSTSDVKERKALPDSSIPKSEVNLKVAEDKQPWATTSIKNVTNVTDIMRRELQGSKPKPVVSGAANTSLVSDKKSGMTNITGVLQRSGLVSVTSSPASVSSDKTTVSLSHDNSHSTSSLSPSTSDAKSTNNKNVKAIVTQKVIEDKKLVPSSTTPLEPKSKDIEETTKSLKLTSISSPPNVLPPPPTAKELSAGASGGGGESISSKLLKAKAKMRDSMNSNNKTSNNEATPLVVVSPPEVTEIIKQPPSHIATVQEVPRPDVQISSSVEEEKSTRIVTTEGATKQTKSNTSSKLLVPSRVLMKKK